MPAKQKMKYILNQSEMKLKLKKKSVQNLKTPVNQMCHYLFNHQLLRNKFLPHQCSSSSQHAKHLKREHTVRGLKINKDQQEPKLEEGVQTGG